MKKKILITAGGTGGHLFPAIALGKELAKSDPSVDLLYVGGNLHQNRYFVEENFPFKAISCGPITAKSPLKIINSVGKLSIGLWQSLRILRQFAPNLVIGFGSYYTFSLLFAARMRSIPFVLHESNSIPGKVNRFFAKHARVTGIHFPETALLIKGKSEEVKMPLREGYRQGLVSADQAKAYFQLHPQRHTCLVFGGSQGARRLNQLFSETIFAHLLHLKKHLQVIHLTGNPFIAEQLQVEYLAHGIHAYVKDFEARMDLAWQAATFAICRAGASTLAEAIEFEVPSILIPYPYATDQHQDKNADFFASHIGGGIRLQEEGLVPERLAQEIQRLLVQRTLEETRRSLQRYKAGTHRKSLCTLVQEALR